MIRISLLAIAALLAPTFPAGAQTAPVAHDDGYTTPQGNNLSVDAPGVLDNDEDADGDDLTAILVDATGTVGTLNLFSDGSFEYETNGFIGVETFTYKANDGSADSNPATITFTVTAGTGLTGYTEEGLYVTALAAQGVTPVFEGFEDDSVWGAARYPVTAPTVTSKGITWESPIGSSQVTTGPGPALQGGWGFFALPHGDYLAGPQCLQPGVCTDRWRGSSQQALVGIGGWVRSAGNGGKVNLYIDDDFANPVELGDSTVFSWRFFGVVLPDGFHTFEFREMEGVSTDAFYIFGDAFTFALRDDPWVDLGQGLAGTHGPPTLAGTGTLLGGEPLSVTLASALENTTAWLLLGLGQWNAPFKGGVLVPSVDLDPLPLPTGPAGTTTLATTWPTGLPGGFTMYLQAWIQDPAGPVGFSASNALAATVP